MVCDYISMSKIVTPESLRFGGVPPQTEMCLYIKYIHILNICYKLWPFLSFPHILLIQFTLHNIVEIRLVATFRK